MRDFVEGSPLMETKNGNNMKTSKQSSVERENGSAVHSHQTNKEEGNFRC